MIEKNDKLIFTEDAVFNSPSAAANMVLGRNSNGNTEWINEKGLTFREVQEMINNEAQQRYPSHKFYNFVVE